MRSKGTHDSIGLAHDGARVLVDENEDQLIGPRGHHTVHVETRSVDLEPVWV